MPPRGVPFEVPPATAQWNRTITHEDYTKMLQGHVPQQMEDKWLIQTNPPADGQQGNTILHIYFGWKPREEISLEIVPGDPNQTDAEDWGTIVKISWKVEFPGELVVEEEEAKLSATRLCNNLLGCKIEEEESEEAEDEDEDEDEDKGKDSKN